MADPVAPVDRVAALVAGIVAGDKATIARALNLVEDRRSVAREDVLALLAVLGPLREDAQCIGITGPPGVGKSSLVANLGKLARKQGRRVGVVAVDPSSIQSGGALLGDRARFGFDPLDDGIFARSLATAGELGGLARVAAECVDVLAASFDAVFVETVGVGQSETEIAHVADSIVLVVQPGSGDTLQFMKAGVMEVPDILVINKADERVLAQRAQADLQAALFALGLAGVRSADRWEVPVLLTSARDGEGTQALLDAIDEHRAALGVAGLRERRVKAATERALRRIERDFGEAGLVMLGGRDAVRARIDAGIAAGGHVVAVAQTVSEPLVRLLTAKS